MVDGMPCFSGSMANDEPEIHTRFRIIVLVKLQDSVIDCQEWRQHDYYTFPGDEFARFRSMAFAGAGNQLGRIFACSIEIDIAMEFRFLCPAIVGVVEEVRKHGYSQKLGSLFGSKLDPS